MLPCGTHLGSRDGCSFPRAIAARPARDAHLTGAGPPSSGWNAWKTGPCSARSGPWPTAAPLVAQAILEANANPGADKVDFDPKLHGTITLTGGEVAITDNLTIVGPGPNTLTISGNDHSRVFDISPDTTVTISGLTIAHGLADKDAPVYAGFGGGILNQGDLTLTDDVVSHNQAVGDGIRTVTGPGGVSITGTGGGGGVATLGTLTVTDSTFIANQALGGDNSVGRPSPAWVSAGASTTRTRPARLRTAASSVTWPRAAATARARSPASTARSPASARAAGSLPTPT